MKNGYDIFKNKITFIILLGILFFAWGSCYAVTGVCNNDELMNHLYSAFKPLLYERSVNQGRLINYYLMYPLERLMNFTENLYIAKIRDLGFIIFSLFSLGCLYYKLFHDYAFAFLTVVLGVAFLPVTFEHTLPQAYCGFAFGFSILIGSVFMYIRWMETSKRNYLIVSLIINLYILFYYETYLMLMPIYAVVTWAMLLKEKRCWKNVLHFIKYHIAISGVYLLLYLGFRMVFPSTYDGNTLGEFSIISIGRVLIQLVLASIPGYYCINAKYRYIFGEFTYNNKIGGGVYDYLDNSFIIFGVALFGIMIVILRVIKTSRSKISLNDTLNILKTALCFVILPLVPIALSNRYQHEVNATNFISVPSVYFSYLAVIFIISFLIWRIIVYWGIKIVVPILIIVMTLSFCIQLMNHVVEREQRQGYYRVKNIEELLETNIVKQLEGECVHSLDLYKIVHALSFENESIDDGYWTVFLRYHGQNSMILNEQYNKLVSAMFYTEEKDGGLLGIRKDNLYFLLTNEKQSYPKAVKLDDENWAIADFNNFVIDNKIFLYSYLIIDNQLLPITINTLEIGDSWENAIRMENIYKDGFIGTTGDFIIWIGEKGKLMLRLYCPFEVEGNEICKIYVNNQEMVCAKVKSGENDYVILTDYKNENIVVQIETNFSRRPSNGDERDLSVVISDVLTE